MTFVPASPAVIARTNSNSLDLSQIGAAIGSGGANLHTAIQAARGKLPEPEIIYETPPPAPASIWSDPMVYVIGGAALLGGGMLLWLAFGDSKPAKRSRDPFERADLNDVLDESER